MKQALDELIASRGLTQAAGRAELVGEWEAAVGPQIAANTRVLSYRDGVVEIGVRHAGLLSQLKSFERPQLLGRLQERHPKIRDLKFRLRGDIAVA